MTCGWCSEPKWLVFSVIRAMRFGSLTELQMVKVATTLDVPIKLLWPKSMVFATERGFTMLGLGDIVVPGMFVALALRYDYHRASTRNFEGGFTKPYFYAVLFAYAAGLGTTMMVMHV